jgi:hypothetical protein
VYTDCNLLLYVNALGLSCRTKQVMLLEYNMRASRSGLLGDRLVDRVRSLYRLALFCHLNPVILPAFAVVPASSQSSGHDAP